MKSSLLNISLTLIILSCCHPLRTQDYFQQQTDYIIKARLDTSSQTLSANSLLKYKNNSEDTINALIIHLYWNAYADKKSRFATQRLLSFERDFHFATADEMGGYTELEISQDGKILSYIPYKDKEAEYGDIIELALDEAIPPGESREILFEYKLKLPYKFSRAGYRSGIYSITQWYPKPAVYDREGWHPMPYLDMGEYYYDFGDYRVELTVPAEMQLASTGVVENISKNRTFKTYLIEANNVTDFAWFASTQFIESSKFITVGVRDVQLKLFTLGKKPNWDRAMEYMERALQFYSQEIAAYPYPQVTVVDGGPGHGGMEYPMITIIESDGSPQELDHLIAHEIGHNWFYGILASDERNHAWLDEGLNTYYELKYNELYYNQPVYHDVLDSSWLYRDAENSLMENFYLYLRSINRDAVPDTRADSLDFMNYMSLSYEKTAWMMSFLQAWLGEEVFSRMMRAYYEQWAFRHPGPEDLRKVMEEESGKDLSWFFEGMLYSRKAFDYSFSGIKRQEGNLVLDVKNKGDLAVPFHITAFDEQGEIISNEWFDGLDKGQSKSISVDANSVYRVSINGAIPFIDNDRTNNHYFPDAFLFKRQKPRLNIFRISDSRYRGINIFPLVLANAYDGVMAGPVISSDLLPARKWRWFVLPAYGFESTSLAGMAAIRRDFHLSGGKGRKLSVGIKGRQFHYLKNEDTGLELKYNKFVPFISINLNNYFKYDSYFSDALSYRIHFLNVERPNYVMGEPVSERSQKSAIHQLEYEFISREPIVISEGLAQLEHENYTNGLGIDQQYLKLSAALKFSWHLNERDKFDLRLFGGYLFSNSATGSTTYFNEFDRASFALSAQGYTDHIFEGLYLARSDQSGFWSRQWREVEGGFRAATPRAFNVGHSNTGLIACNITSDIPFLPFNKFNMRVFADLAISKRREVGSEPLENKFYYSTGLAIEINDLMGIYWPIFNSDEIDDAYGRSNFYDRLSFRLNLNMFNAWEHVDDPLLFYGY